MISKKEILLQILQKLTPYREEAEGLSMVIGTSYLTDDTIDALVHLLSQSIQHTKNSQQKTKMENAVAVIQKIQLQEKTDMELEQADILLQELEL